MRKITKRSISILCVCIMVFFVGTIGVNANTGNSLESYQLKALGRLESDVDKSGTAGDNPEDFVYDADDLYAIENMVRTGKAQLASSINAYKTGNVKTLDTFTNLSSAVDSLTDFPNGIYYYDATTGKSDATTLVRYIKENDSYYLCDQFGNKISDTAQSVDVNNLVEYKELEQENLTAGTAGMVGKSFVLGNGSDNISYRNQHKATVFTKSPIDMSLFTSEWKNLTELDFICGISNVSCSIFNNSNSACTTSFSEDDAFSYNRNTGLLTFEDSFSESKAVGSGNMLNAQIGGKKFCIWLGTINGQ